MVPNTRGSNASQSSPMEGFKRGDDLVAALLVTKFSPELKQTFVRFSAAIAEKTPAEADQIRNPIGQPALRLIII